MPVNTHYKTSRLALKKVGVLAVACWTTVTLAQPGQCTVQSGATITPVVELYTSEGCSSCPPADQWLSTLKGSPAVAYTQRQKEIATKNSLRNIYTPQAVLDGKDWPRWGGLPASTMPAKASISLKQIGTDQFEASVTPIAPTSGWSAYWTVTEHGHNSKVLSGENKGEFLKHDFVVRQYTPAEDYTASGTTPQKLVFRSIAATSGHPRQVNLVVFDRKTFNTLQAVSLSCAS